MIRLRQKSQYAWLKTKTSIEQHQNFGWAQNITSDLGLTRSLSRRLSTLARFLFCNSIEFSRSFSKQKRRSHKYNCTTTTVINQRLTYGNGAVLAGRVAFEFSVFCSAASSDFELDPPELSDFSRFFSRSFLDLETVLGDRDFEISFFLGDSLLGVINYYCKSSNRAPSNITPSSSISSPVSERLKKFNPFVLFEDYSS